MNKRVREIRKMNNLNMEQFGGRIGVTRSAISRIESGERSVTEQMIKSICREFNINEEWLRTGKGNKELQLNNIQDEFTHAVNQIYTNDPRAKNLILEYWKLSPKDKELFMNFMEKFVVK